MRHWYFACLRRFVLIFTCFVVSAADAGPEVIQDRVFTANFEPFQPPDDPSNVAPELDSTTASDLYDSTQFLYAGGAPVQIGADAGGFDRPRVAVLRGQVLDTVGSPLVGVRVSVKGFSQYGFTLTRGDGAYDLVVNGGGLLTLEFEKAGLLTAQRSIDVPWQRYVSVNDVSLIPLDDNATTLDLTSGEMGVARGSVIADADGTRQATLMCPVGTEAELVFPDGSTQTISTLTVRATEYTVGDYGDEAMPGVLPPASGYTYAVELSADEAIAAGASDIQFSQPMPFYVENFLGFPVGSSVPTGYYDKVLATWIASENGRVVEIVGESDGNAEIDIDGDGVADDSATLSALGISEDETMNLSVLYDPGQQLWRVPIGHFTPWDHNWPYGPPEDATGPNQGQPESPNAGCGPRSSSCLNCSGAGSILECQPQVLGEMIPVNGTEFFLSYRSDRAPGRVDNRRTVIPLSGDEPPASLTGIVVDLSVLGQRARFTRSAAANQSLTYTWDGLDVYGRKHRGPATLTANIGYVYDAVYRTPAQAQASFSRFGLEALESNRARRTFVISQKIEVPLNAPEFSQFAGWTLSVHHHYDTTAQVLYRGDGGRRSALATGRVVRTATGGGSDFGTILNDFSAPNGEIPARDFTPTSARLSSSMAVDAEGRLYLPGGAPPAIYDATQLVRLDPDGFVRLVAGTGEPPPRSTGTEVIHPPEPDGIAALDARLHLQHVAIGPDKAVYVDERNTHVSIGVPQGYCRIRRISATGIIDTVAGTTCARDFSDVMPYMEGPAIDAELRPLQSLIAGPDGSLYFSDSRRVFGITPAGILYHIAGNGNHQSSGDGGQATAAAGQFTALQLNELGELLVVDSGSGCRVRKVNTDGIIETIVGPAAPDNSACGYAEGPATGPVLNNPEDIALLPNGDLLIADSGNHRIRLVNPEGEISTLAGSDAGFSGDNGAIAGAQFIRPDSLALGPDSQVYVFDEGNRRVRSISSSFPGFSAQEIFLAGESGKDLYVFDGDGRHLRTLNTLTGDLLFEFTYDQSGWLTAITDGDGNTTQIERTDNGQPQAVVSAFGQRTVLSVGGDGYLQTVTNPENEAWTFDYDSEGLMQGSVDPRGHLSQYRFDDMGRLVEAANEGESAENLLDDQIQTFSRIDGEAGDFEVTLTSAEGTETRYGVSALIGGGTRRTNTFDDGTVSVTIQGRDGIRSTTATDGTVLTNAFGPDPRWGMQVPNSAVTTISTPGGVTSTTTHLREVTLANPLDPLSLLTQTDTFTRDGRSLVRVFDSASNTFNITTAQGIQSTVSIDGQGRLVSAQVGSFAPIEYDYDERGQLAAVSAAGANQSRVTSFGYNLQGHLNQIIDARGNTQQFGYDLAGRLTSQTLANGSTIEFEFDESGNLTVVTPPGRPAYTFAYTPRGNLASETAPDVGEGPAIRSYRYDRDGALMEIRRADGRLIEPTYDVFRRLEQVSVPRGTISLSYENDTGLISEIVAPDGQAVQFAYDGFLPTAETLAGEVAGSVSRTYNQLRVQSLQVNSESITFEYDDDNRLTRAGDLILVRSPEHGQVIGTELGTFTDAVEHNDFVEVENYSARIGLDDPLYEISYQRNAMGQILTKTETVQGITSIYAYAYDSVNRLISATANGLVEAEYTYDANSNRISDGIATATYDDQDRLTTYGNRTYTYTADGELSTRTVSGQTTGFSYDVFGNLLEVTLPTGVAVSYVVDGQNRRVGKRIDGSLTQGFLYQDDLNVVAELDGANTVVSRFVYGSLGHVPDYMIKDGRSYRLITDNIGSVRMVVNSQDGTVAQKITYGPFGEVLDDTNPGFQPFGYAGGLYDPDTGLTRFGARDYDPEVGRWTSKDPRGFGGESPNLYAYVFNDPINLFDPNGEFLPLLAAALLVLEVSLSIADILACIDTLIDPCRSKLEAAAICALAALGVVVPGGGYGLAGSMFFQFFKTSPLKALKGLFKGNKDDLLTNSPILKRLREQGGADTLSRRALKDGQRGINNGRLPPASRP